MGPLIQSRLTHGLNIDQNNNKLLQGDIYEQFDWMLTWKL